MKIKYAIKLTLIQGSLTALIVYLYGLINTFDFEQAALSTGALVLFLGVFNAIFGLLLYNRLDGLLKALVVSVFSSLLTTLVFILYPELGLSIEWYLLLVLLIFSAIFAHLLLYSDNKNKEAPNT